MAPTRDWFTIAEVSDSLGVPIPTLYKWVHAGLLHADLAGKGTHLIHQSAVEALRRNGNRPAKLRRYTRQLASA